MPPVPRHLRWVNRGSLAHGGRPAAAVLVEFWDFCRANSMRTLPYMKAWHERYGARRPDAGGAQARSPRARAPSGEQRGGVGLQLVGVHCPGYEASRPPDAVERAVERLGITYPVLVDGDLEMWREYENRGWPARYLFDGRGLLFHYHYGEGAYRETELAIQELLALEREPLAPLRPEDAPDALLVPQTPDREGAYSGPYEAGGVWAVLDGRGTVRVAGSCDAEGGELAITQPGAYPLIEHERHTAGVLELEIGEGVGCLATCFTPGVA